MSTAKRVALVVETSNEYARGLLHGVRAFIRRHGPWSIVLGEDSRGHTDASWLANWDGDGIIARIENAQIAKSVIASGLPAVDLSAARLATQFPMVETDDRAIARLAAEHLLDRGLEHFGFAGQPGFQWSDLRQRQFVKRLKQDGHDCATYPPTGRRRARRTLQEEIEALAGWIETLPRPVGVMAAFDVRGRQVLEACRIIDVTVPDEVAVIGVDNDELLCDLADPPMTSVAPDTDRTGWLAAELLDKMMAGQTVAPDAHLIPPIGVVARESTDILNVADPAVADALRLIRAKACDGVRVADVLNQVGLTRRALDARFQKLLGRSAHAEIRRLQIERIQQLLRETDLPLAEIAHRTGFKHVEYLSVAFKKAVGVPPAQFRAQFAT